ncbi:MAG: 50S ribosomal protein L11 methyltransferase [Deltaproteobacteria bacterium]|nr:50S ribosomal protein L11 methyltransferase [Deltaproteobacteria bacterium]
MATEWIEINAKGPRNRKDEASLILIDAGSPGVLEEDESSKVGTLLSYSTWDKETEEEPETSKTASIKGYLAPDKTEMISRIGKDLKKIGWQIATSHFQDQDWSVKWKAHIKPIKVKHGNSSIVVKPTWREVEKKKGDIIIEIDPGMAFGTGGHATTKMCVKAIFALIKDKKVRASKANILDVGTGTGILAIAAMKLGVSEAVGTDIDKVALTVARKNARLNKTEIRLSSSSLDKIKGGYSIVAANILAGELKRLSPALYSKITPGGYIILSGILKTEKDSVKETFTALGLKHSKTYLSGEWAAIVLQASSK